MDKYLLLLLFIIGCGAPPEPYSNIILETSIVDKDHITSINNLTLREKIAQMIMVRIRGDYYNDQHWYRKKLEKYLSEYGIGGVITFGGSIHGTYYNIQQFQKLSKYPLLVASDYERGLGQWMKGGTLFPSNMAIAATADSSLAYEQGKITAMEARALGVHITFSPVMDINNNPNNPIINFRSYSDNPNIVSSFGSQFIKGAQENGLIACAKHFPGHGNTDTDSHSKLPTILGDKKELHNMELVPFKAAINSGVKMIMTGHISMPGLDETGAPASHSHSISTDLLRNDLGFSGIVITDGMEMGALSRIAWSGESAVRAVESGADILLLPMDIDQTIQAIFESVISGRVSESRINQSVQRIWQMKSDIGILDDISQSSFKDLEKKLGIPDHFKLAKKIAKKSITIAKDSNNQLPLKLNSTDSLVHIILSLDDGARGYIKLFSSDIKRTHGRVKEIFINDKISTLGSRDIINQMSGIDQVIISLIVRIRMDKGIATIDSTHSLLISDLEKTSIPIVVFSFGSPYLPSYENIDTYVCTYGYGSISVKAAADALWGRTDVNGVLPIKLNTLMPQGYGLKKKKIFKNWDVVTINNFENATNILQNAIKQKVFPGAQVVVLHNGKMLLNRGFGKQTYIDTSSLIDRYTIYDVASLTKVLVTVPIIMKLVSQNKISLDQSIYQFHPSFKGNDKKNVTIRHLLTHSSGLPAYYPFYNKKKIKTKNDVLDYIIKINLNESPGFDFKYSDLGFILLTSIIEKVSKQTIDKLAYNYLFSPLGMSNTCYLPPLDWKIKIAPTEYDSMYRKSLVHGVVHDENAYLMGGVSGHSGVFSTAEDIAKYAQMLVDSGVWNGKRIFSESLINEFVKVQNIPNGSDMALGWDTPSKSGYSVAGDYFSLGSFGHLGFTGTSLWIDPNEKIIIILLTNRVYPDRRGKQGKEEMYVVRRNFYNAIMKEI